MPKGENPNSHKAGAKNLQKFLSEHPDGPRQCKRHGAFNQTVRQRYSDLRTTEGRKLQEVIDSVTSDLGGPDALNAAQRLLMSSLRGKLIVVFQISDYLDRQESLISEGELLPCLRDSYLKYSTSITQILKNLYGLMQRDKNKKIPRIEDMI